MYLLAGFCDMHWLISWILPFLLGLALGWWLWSRYKQQVSDLKGQIKGYKSTIGDLELALSDCKSKRADLEGDLALTKGKMREMEGEMDRIKKESGGASSKKGSGKSNTKKGSSDSGDLLVSGLAASGSDRTSSTSSSKGKGDAVVAGLSAIGASTTSNDDDYGQFSEDNLQIFEGIGPKMEEVLKENGIHNWTDLGRSKDAELRGILDKYGDKYKIINPESWAEQASMAATGNWSGLVQLQKDLDGGVATGVNNTDAKIEKLLGKAPKGKGSKAKSKSGKSKGKGSGKVRGYAGLKNDNMQIIEGVGPKMDSILKENGLNTWSDVASQSESDLRAMLNKYGDKYRIIDPKSWSKQAELAAAGDWAGLVSLQQDLDGGRASGNNNTDAKVDKVLVRLGLKRKYKQDDLKVVEGVGPKIEGLLHEAGVKTWRALADTSVAKIQEVLDAAGSRYKLADPGTWPKQADLADKAKWDELEEYQDFLQGGK